MINREMFAKYNTNPLVNEMIFVVRVRFKVFRLADVDSYHGPKTFPYVRMKESMTKTDVHVQEVPVKQFLYFAMNAWRF